MGMSMQGLKVLDFSMGIAGPQAGMLCAMQGADVVKIESLQGDWSRTLGPQFGDLTAYATVCNRGKRSLAIDLKDAAAQHTVRALARQADVVIEAFRPGVMDRLGLGYAQLVADNPDIVYLSVNGFGSSGPMVDAPATDIVLQAFSGFMFTNKGSDGMPRRLDQFIIDQVTGLYAFQSIATSLLEIARTGRGGRHIECSLLNAAMALQASKIAEKHLTPADQAYFVPLGVYASRDGFVSMSVRTDEHFARLCRLLGREDLLQSGDYTTNAQRVAARTTLEAILCAEFVRLSSAQLVELLVRADILHSEVQDYGQTLAHPQLDAAQSIEWLQQDGIDAPVPIANIPGDTGGHAASQAPHIGQHSRSVLADWSTAANTIDDLCARGVVRVGVE